MANYSNLQFNSDYKTKLLTLDGILFNHVQYRDSGHKNLLGRKTWDTTNASGTLKPKKYGGLSYVIRGYKDSNNCVLINTKNFGQVKIFIKNTPATITSPPTYNVVG